jgi:hypothetical protein
MKSIIAGKKYDILQELILFYIKNQKILEWVKVKV